MKKLTQSCILTGAAPEELRRAAVERAAWALCTSPREDGPCGACRSCRKVFAGVHPDVEFLEREEDKSGKLRKEIVVEQIRSMAQRSSVLPNEGAVRVIILPEADTMNENAQNAFLKLLEEPPAFLLFELCARRIDSLLPTIRSRCAPQKLGAGGESEDGEEALQRAEQFLDCVKDSAGRLLCCAGMEKLTGAELLAVMNAARHLAVERFAPGPGVPELEEILSTAMRYLQQNVGVKHVTGYLAVTEMRNELWPK